MKAISDSIKRFDFDDKIQGRAIYTSDYHLECMFYAKTLRSTVPRAKIKNIITPEIPQGYFIVDHRDVPAQNYIPVVFDDQPIFAVEIGRAHV